MTTDDRLARIEEHLGKVRERMARMETTVDAHHESATEIQSRLARCLEKLEERLEDHATEEVAVFRSLARDVNRLTGVLEERARHKSPAAKLGAWILGLLKKLLGG